MEEEKLRILVAQLREKINLAVVDKNDWTVAKFGPNGEILSTMQITRQNLEKLLKRAAEKYNFRSS